MIELIEEYRVPKAVPHNSSITEVWPRENPGVCPLCEFKAKNVITEPAAMAPKNAKRLTGEIKVNRDIPKGFPEDILKGFPEVCPRLAVPSPKQEAITAPIVAPELIPIKPGSASSFLKKS